MVLHGAVQEALRKTGEAGTLQAGQMLQVPPTRTPLRHAPAWRSWRQRMSGPALPGRPWLRLSSLTSAKAWPH